MYRVFVDTNILLDLVTADRENHEVCKGLVKRCIRQDVSLHALASSYKDVYYVFMRHHGSEADARDAVRKLRRAFETVELTDGIVATAIDSDEPDFEDGIIRAAAESAGAYAIVSRDATAFANSPVPKMHPAEFKLPEPANAGLPSTASE